MSVEPAAVERGIPLHAGPAQSSISRAIRDFSSYRSDPRRYDELLDGEGRVREPLAGR